MEDVMNKKWFPSVLVLSLALFCLFACSDGSKRSPGPPVAATGPNPSDGETGVRITTNLSWGAVSGASGYFVHFGIDNSPAYHGETATHNYTLTGDLDYETTYYWRVIPYNLMGNASKTEVWSFRTRAETDADYFVCNVTGNDANDGESWETAFKTISKGLAGANDGHTVKVADGTYTGDLNRNLNFGGKAITLMSENGA